jgi:hypothetical protein
MESQRLVQPGLQKGKTSGVASLHAGQLTLLVSQTDIFTLFCLHAGEFKINSLYSSIKPAIFYSLSLSEHQRSKPVSQDIQLHFIDVVPRHLEN